MKQNRHVLLLCFLASILGAFLGVGIFWLSIYSGMISVSGSAQSLSGGSGSNISYSEFISVMLTVVTVLLTVMAIGIAVFSFYSFQEISEKAAASAKEEVKKEYKEMQGQIDELKLNLTAGNEDLRKIIINVITEHFNNMYIHETSSDEHDDSINSDLRE
ncbi:MAG: hypothetical protein ISN29_11855 [Gammaproteobacteria bacterium AqS3]|nr:hypothetical protein [Gammaproteobacteria bacterium AqS3]